MSSNCHGNGEDHCCYFVGMQCEYLEENTVEGRRWTCGLVRRYGNSGEAFTSKEWIDNVRPLWLASGLPDGFTCADWPNNMYENIEGPGFCCWST